MNDYGIRARLGSLLRGSPVGEIKRCLRVARDNDVRITAAELEAHHLAGGRIGDLVEALAYAKEHGLSLSLTRAAAEDLVHGGRTKVSDWVRNAHRDGLTDLDRAPSS